MPTPSSNRTRRIEVAAMLACLMLLAGCAGAPPPPEPAPEAAAPVPDAEIVMIEAETMAQEERYEEAATILEQLVEREQTNTVAMKLLANVYAALGLRERSSETWARIEALAPGDPDAAYETGIALARNGQWQILRTKMLFLESSGSMESRHYLLLGEADLELGYRTEAELYLKKAAGEPRAHYLLGRLYYAAGRSERAETEFETVLRRDPDNHSAHLHLGWLSYRKGDTKRALGHYRTAVRLNPGDALSALSLAGLLEELNRRDEAIERYIEALELPGIPSEEKKKAFNSLSRLLVETKRHGEAEAVIKRGLAQFPGSGGLHYQWGVLLLAEGRNEEAIEELRRSARDPVWKETALRKIHTIR
jgi:tetratricopeptide (TPR) repeat protein